MSGSGGGLEPMEQFLQADALYAEYGIFLESYEALQQIETAVAVLPVIQVFCYELNGQHEVMRSVTRLYSASHTDFQRALFCSWLALSVARHFNLSMNHQRNLFVAGLLQDIGKYVVDDSVSRFIANLGGNKIPVYGQHNLEDAHPLLSSSFIEHQFPDEEKLKNLVLYHHARADGTGYPNYVVESQLALDEQILIVANEINDRLDHIGGFAKFFSALPYLKLAGLMYFNRVQQSLYRWFSEIYAQQFVGRSCNEKAASRASDAHNASIKNLKRTAILTTCIERMLDFSAELVPYDFDIVVRGIRSNISRMLFVMNETGLACELAFSEDQSLSLSEQTELDDLFVALPECLHKLAYYFTYLKNARQFELDSSALASALEAVKECLFAFDRGAVKA